MKIYVDWNTEQYFFSHEEIFRSLKVDDMEILDAYLDEDVLFPFIFLKSLAEDHIAQWVDDILTTQNFQNFKAKWLKNYIVTAIDTYDIDPQVPNYIAWDYENLGSYDHFMSGLDDEEKEHCWEQMEEIKLPS